MPARTHQGHRGPKGLTAPWSTGQLYNFVGTTTKGGTTTVYAFDVLAGQGGPKASNLGAKVNTIPRPRRKGFTVAIGYDPLQLDIPIQFEALADRPDKGLWLISPDIDADIQKLNWMAGRGKLWPAGQAAIGDPPLVTVASFTGGSNSTQTSLIPPDFQFTGHPGDVQWLVTNVDYDQSDAGHIINAKGKTVRQAATVTLMEYSQVPNANTEDSPAARQKSRGNSSAYVVEYTDTKDATVAAITRKFTQRTDAKSYQSVLSMTRAHGVKVRSYLQKLPTHTKIYIPTSLLP